MIHRFHRLNVDFHTEGVGQFQPRTGAPCGQPAWGGSVELWHTWDQVSMAEGTLKGFAALANPFRVWL